MHFIIRRLLAALTLGFTCSAVAETITIRADEWYPMNGDPGSETPGYMIEFAREIFSAGGHQVDYQVMPWERALVSVREGEFDCVVGAYPEDAPDFLFPEAHWGIDRTFFYVRKGNPWRYTGLDSLQGQTVGLVGGYAYGDEFDAFMEKQDASMAQYIRGNNALDKNIKKLLADRVSVTLESESVMNAKLQEMKLAGQVDNAGPLAEPSEMYIACSPAKAISKEIIRMVNEGTRQMRADGRMQAILQKYGLAVWE